MSTERIQHERELFERYKKQRAPGANLQRIGDEYVDMDVQWHFETWLARADLAPPEAAPAAPAVQAEPVAVAITEKQVMTACFSASRLHISGTSNWFAAFAQSLNKQIAAPPAIPAQPDAALVDALEDLLSKLDGALKDLDLFGLHSDQGYRKLKGWYRKMMAATKAVDAALAGKGATK